MNCLAGPSRTVSPREFLRSLDRRVLALFLVAVALCLADVVIPELFAGGKTKDYELWFNTGRAVLDGGDIYGGRGDGLLELPLSALRRGSAGAAVAARQAADVWGAGADQRRRLDRRRLRAAHSLRARAARRP